MIGKRALSFGVCIGCCFRGCYRYQLEAVRRTTPPTLSSTMRTCAGQLASLMATIMTGTVLAGPERRRRWTTAEKLRIVEESFKAGISVVEFARQRDPSSPTWCTLGGGRRAREFCRRVRIEACGR